MANPCKHMFLMEDGYCPNCGQVIKPGKRGKPASVKAIQAPKPRQLEMELSKPITHAKTCMQIARETTELLSQTYGIKVSIHSCGRNGAYHKLDKSSGKHEIHYGIAYMQNIWSDGFTDYRANWIVSTTLGKEPKGEKAIKALVAHEFAHVLQTQAGQRVYGRMHGRYWENKYLEIMGLLF